MENFKTFAGDLDAELQEILELDSASDENIRSLTADYSPVLTIICC